MASTDSAQVLRSLEEADALIERAERLINEERYREAGETLGSGYRLFGLDSRKLHAEDPRRVHRHLQAPEQMRGLAGLLAAAADLLRRGGDFDAAASTAKWTLSALLHGSPPGDYSAMTSRLIALAAVPMAASPAGG